MTPAVLGARAFIDPLRFEQAFSNVLTNALKYGAGKPIEVRVTDRGAQIAIAVKDHGIGIAGRRGVGRQRRRRERPRPGLHLHHHHSQGRGLNAQAARRHRQHTPRAGLPIGRWFEGRARQHGKFAVELVEFENKAWSAKVAAADAFVFVTPEDNYRMPAPPLNALHYLYHEWNHKLAAFVSQWGRNALGAVRQAAPHHAEEIAHSRGRGHSLVQQAAQGGVFDPADPQDKAITGMLDELLRWSTALVTLRGH